MDHKSGSRSNMDNVHWKSFWKWSTLFIFIVMTIMSFWYGASGDEADMNYYGKAILDYFTSFGSDQRALKLPKEFDRDGVLHLYGGFFDLIAALVNKISPLEEYTTRHILNSWAGFLAIFFSSKITIKISNYRAATFLVWLMFLAPFFLGHAMNNPKDIPFATAYITAIYFGTKFIDMLPEIRWKDYILPIITLSIAIDIRVAGILLIPYMFIYYFLTHFQKKEGNKMSWRSILPICIVSVIGYLGASLFWPFALQNPISNPLFALQELSNFKMSLAQLYEGKVVFSNALPKSFLIKNFIITNTYVLLTGLLLFVFFLFEKSVQRDYRKLIFIVFISLFPLFYIIYKGSNVYHAWRHVLFIFPGIAILSALGYEYMLQIFRSPKSRKIIIGLFFIGLLEPAYFIINTFPNTITYYNGIVGGVKKAYFDYEMDYYYNSLKTAADWFAENELTNMNNDDTLIVATNAAHLLPIYLKNNTKVKTIYVRFNERSLSDWDYAIFHRALVPRGLLEDLKWKINGTIYSADVKGLPLTIVVKRPSHADYEGMELLKQKRYGEAYTKFKEYRNADPNNETVNKVYNALHTEIQKKQQKAINQLTRQPARSK